MRKGTMCSAIYNIIVIRLSDMQKSRLVTEVSDLEIMQD